MIFDSRFDKNISLNQHFVEEFKEIEQNLERGTLLRIFEEILMNVRGFCIYDDFY